MLLAETVASRRATTYPDASNKDPASGDAAGAAAPGVAAPAGIPRPAGRVIQMAPAPASTAATSTSGHHRRRGLRCWGVCVRSIRSLSRSSDLGSIGPSILRQAQCPWIIAVPPTAAERLKQRNRIGVAICRRSNLGDARLLIGLFSRQQG